MGENSGENSGAATRRIISQQDVSSLFKNSPIGRGGGERRGAGGGSSEGTRA